MPVNVPVSSQVIVWARERSRRDYDDLLHQFPRLPEWEAGSARPTLPQLEKFSRATYTPIGLLLLADPPVDELPVPDFRTMVGQSAGPPSPALLDTVYLCEQRQDWYREHATAAGEARVDFVGSARLNDSVVETAAAMRDRLDFGRDVRSGFSSWSEALRELIRHAEGAGVLVMVNGVVGNNTHRKLDPREFRGFALADDLAPLVFVNGVDSKAAQIFTLAHELAHLWVAATGVSDTRVNDRPATDPERWCNSVAGELLVPLAWLEDEYRPNAPLADEMNRLAGVFRVSTLVALRRLFDAGRVGWDEYRQAHETELARVLAIAESRESDGGNFYNTEGARVGRRFARAIVASTLEGSTTYRDAFHLLGFRKHSTFETLSQRLGVA